MHVHVSPVDAVAVGCYVVIFAFAWRTVAAKVSHKPIGQAMAYIL